MTSTFPARSSGGPRGRADRTTVRQGLALAVLLTANFTVTADFSILNVALPRIGAEIGFSLGGLQWVATSFSLCSAGFILLFGRIADLFGRRRIFLLGIAALGASSLAGGLAAAPWILIVARVIQGLATAAVTPAALSLLTTSFPEGPLRERALGLNGALMAGGFTTGAVAGGLLTDLLSWRWAFFVNVIIAVAVLAAGPTVLPESRPRRRPRMDIPGALTVTLALLALIYGLTQAGERSWTDPHVYAALALGATLLALFAAVEKRADEPLIPTRILRLPAVRCGNIAGLLAFATITSVVYLQTLYSQDVLGHSPLWTGCSFTAMGGGSILGGALGPKIIARIGIRTAFTLGLTLQGVTTLPLAFLGFDGAWTAVLLAATFLAGAGNLVAIVAFMVTATSGLSDRDQGIATGLATMSQQIGFTVGIPVMSAITTARLHALGASTPYTLLHSLTLALAVNALICLASAPLLHRVLPASGPRPATS
ncbi:MFS transporter [Microbispora corallina]|uniref:MFS transporter n=1 Tax=Microbispora corallina TaxID=83302 RepID=A0ABQ4GAZ9_9ACTN|nr:MFS transporter [Microbispora corallina]GIH44254.1 MFS transporter [Microbispora corallina]